MAGWPVSLGTPTNGQPYTPTLFDVDGDGAAEIFVHGGETFGLHGDGSFLEGWPAHEMEYMGYGAQGHLPGPSVGDLDGDGVADVLWSLRDWYAGSSRTWTFNARRRDGSNVSGFPQASPVSDSLALFNPFVVGDTSASGFVAAAAALITEPEGVHQFAFFSAAGAARTTVSLAPGNWVVSLHYGDLDGDGHTEFFALSWNGGNWSISLHVFDSQGREMAGYPRPLVALTTLTYVGGTSIAADLDRDGDLEILTPYFDNVAGYIDCFHHYGLRCDGFPINAGSGVQVMQLALGNLKGDSSAAHLVVLGWDRFESVYKLIAIDIGTGSWLPGWPITLPPSAHWAAIGPGVPIIFDANGDGVQDICIAHVDGGLYVFSGAGTLLPGYPQQMKSPSISGAAVGDIDGDGYFEIIAATWDGWVYAWRTPSPAYENRADWPMAAGDARNTGVYRSPDATGSPCEPSETTLCLHSNRFAVRAHGVANGNVFVGHATQRTVDSGYFWFFDSSNYEVLIKALDACSLNNRFWVFSAGLSNVEFTLDVRDTQTGREYLVHNPQGYKPPAVLNTNPNFTCDGTGVQSLTIETTTLAPAEAPLISEHIDAAVIGTCVPDANTACLHGGLFRVHGEFTAEGSMRAANVNKLSDQSFEALFFSDTNVELTGKILDGRALTGSYWVFNAGTTDVAAKLWVENTQTGQVWMQQNLAGHVFSPAQDTSTSFTTGPAGLAPSRGSS